MIVYKIYQSDKYEEYHTEYFNQLLETIKQCNLLSQSIEEIIFTDDIKKEIENYSNSSKRFRVPNLTKTREFLSIAKTIDFEGKKKIFFDANNVNAFIKQTPQIFITQLIEVYAEDLVSNNYKVTEQFYADTLLPEIIKIYFSHWATKVVAFALERINNFPHENINTDVKMFVDAYKRNIRRLQYKHQKDLALDEFWINVITELDSFIRNCLNVKNDKGNFKKLEEFKEVIPILLSEIETQTNKLLRKEEINLTKIHSLIQEILKKCSIEVPNESKLIVNIIDTPKKLFKNNIVDTEPRLVAFIDILGFSAIIEEYDSDDYSNILNELHDTLETAIRISIENMTNPETKTDLKEYLEYRMFSDCICISLPYIEFGNDFHIQFHSLATIAKAYQLAMMQKGFFVRGAISAGSFYSDKNMIFSGGLVSAYKIEQNAKFPIIVIDELVLERLRVNFFENAKGLFYENTMLYMKSEPQKIFLHPFDFLDNAKKYLDFMQSTVDNIIKSNEEDKDNPYSELITSALKQTNSFTKPVFEVLKEQLKPESINAIKLRILDIVNEQLLKQRESLSKKADEEYKKSEKIVVKFEFLKKYVEWSIGMADSDFFKFHNLN